jgi:hypothetical protein
MHHKRAPKAILCDALSASVDMDPNALIGALNVAMGTTHIPGRPLPGRGYSHAAELVNPDTLAPRALVMSGDRHAKPHVFAEGVESYDTPALYEALRTRCPGLWTPSRLDVAVDFDGADTFDEIAAVALALADRRGVDISQMGDWHRGRTRTLALGSRASAFYLRIYEFRQKHGWGYEVRFELEVKVKPAHRLRIASMSLADIIGLHGLSAEILREIGVDIQRAPLHQERRPPSTLESDLAWLSSQCWPAMCRVVSAHGGDIAAAWGAIATHRDETAHVRELLTERTVRDNPDDLSHTATPWVQSEPLS